MAFNIHEDYWDRPFVGNDQTNRIPHGLALFLSGLFCFLVKVVFRFRKEGQEVIDQFKGKKCGALLVSPHYSYLDVVIMFLSMRRKGWVRLIARDSLFTAAHGFLGTCISSVGAIPIKRDTADRTAMKRATRSLKNGEWIGLFPEGTRRGKGSAEPALHGGVALMARMGKAPIIPLGLINVNKVKRKGERLRLPRITARFGKPISVSEFDFLPKDERMDACSWYVMREAYALTFECAPEEVKMAELFPDSKDYTQVFAEHPIATLDPATLPDYEPKES